MPSGSTALAALLWVGTLLASTPSVLRVGGTAQALAPQPNGGGEDCQRTCGEKAINYPFGAGPDHCSFSLEFHLDCRDTGKLFFSTMDLVEVLNISLLSGEVQVMNYISSYCYDASSGEMVPSNWHWDLTGTPYMFSHQANKFTVMGCRTLAYIGNPGNDVTSYMTGCVSFWLNGTYPTSDCSGMGCCQTTIPEHLQYYQVWFDGGFNSSELESSCNCSYAVLMDSSNFTLSTDYLTSLEHFNDTFSGRAPVMLQWVIGDEACDVARKKTRYACVSDNSDCSSALSGQGYICKCKDGFQGNPYLEGPDGCTDINECDNAMAYGCYGNCINEYGSFNCSCPAGQRGDPNVYGSCRRELFSSHGVRLGIGTRMFCLNYAIAFKCSH